MSTLKERIEKMESELSELKVLAEKEEIKEEFKVGDWVLLKGKDTGNGTSGHSNILQLLDIDHSKNPTGNLENDSHFMVQFGIYFYTTNKKWIIRLATHEEVEKKLIAEANSKGFVKGAKVRPVSSNEIVQYSKGSPIEWSRNYAYGIREITGFKLINNELLIEVSGTMSCIFFKLEAFEPLPSYPLIEKCGYKAEFHEWGISFNDCAKMHKRIFIKMLEVIRMVGSIESEPSNGSNRRIEGIKIGKADFTREEIEKIAEHYNKK